jgi:predicted hydrocarbon binding protein
MELKVDFSFDDRTYRHYMNGFLSVLHCHHYLCLTTKMAIEYNGIGGLKILQESIEDAVRPMFEKYFEENGVQPADSRLEVGSKYYGVMGLGQMSVSGSAQGGEVTLSKSHIDQGWLKKWGSADKPVNYFTCGYISAMFGAAFEKPARSYQVVETESMAGGQKQCRFVVTPAQ